jgi:signal peptidase II
MEKSQALVIIFFVFLDLLTKHFASKFFSVSLNTGVSLGLFNNLSPVIMFFLLLIICLVIIFFLFNYFIPTSRDNFFLSLFIAGTLANLIDRFYNGGVRDWLSLPFLGFENNLADLYIFIGLIGIIILELKNVRKN